MSRLITPEDAMPVVFYMHIPKAAGTSISGVLFDCLRKKERSSEQHGHLFSDVYYYPSGFVETVRQKRQRCGKKCRPPPPRKRGRSVVQGVQDDHLLR